jgi:DNA-binding beta-propeller fold protein YncE
MYIVGSSADNIREFSLSTAWDISTASFVQALAIGAQEGTSQAITFSPDGIHMFVIGSIGQDVNQYALSTAWNISTATFVRASSTLPDTFPAGIVFRPDGLRMYILGSTTDLIYQYNLSTAWNVSTITLDKTLPIGYLEATPTGLAIKTDGTKLYIVGNITDSVYELSLG